MTMLTSKMKFVSQSAVTDFRLPSVDPEAAGSASKPFAVVGDSSVRVGVVVPGSS